MSGSPATDDTPPPRPGQHSRRRDVGARDVLAANRRCARLRVLHEPGRALCRGRAAHGLAAGQDRADDLRRRAFVAQGAADHPIDLKDFGPALQLAVRQTKTEVVFAFRGDAGRTSEVTLALPGTISIFEVDPRGGEPDSGLGPTLYKEWQLTGTATAAGVLRPLVESRDQKLTLIVHGRGRGCTEASEFTDWTLTIHGPAGKLTLYGALTSAAR
jgi:hypothetical protein